MQLSWNNGVLPQYFSTADPDASNKKDERIKPWSECCEAPAWRKHLWSNGFTPGSMGIWTLLSSKKFSPQTILRNGDFCRKKLFPNQS